MRPGQGEGTRLQPGERVRREAIERGSQVRGLLVLALAVIIFSIWRAGVHRLFGVGWWRLW